MQSVRPRRMVAAVLAAGVIGAALSACGPQNGGSVTDTAGAAPAKAAATGGDSSPSAAVSSPSASASATGRETTPPSAPPAPTTPAATKDPSSPATTKTSAQPPGQNRTQVPPQAQTRTSTGAPAKAQPNADGAASGGTAANPGHTTSAPAPANSDTTGSDRTAGSAEALSLKLINEERARNGVPALVVKDDLTEFAVNWARHMRETGFAHSENASGAGPSLTGSRTLTGECIVMWGDASLTGEQAAEQFQKMWTESPGHHAAQINPRYTQIGVGLYHDSSGWWGVHEFAG
ncbi:CAP domain-containing protein [Kitasatospora sp. NPDC004669]|uniref:CAP domain-containing protein n=1 Tax=Kitasatospora sp. NPDC004669 TaxID=3154555 RepID=UPI0033AB3E24